MTPGEGVTARQASIGGPGTRAALRLCAVLCWLSVPMPVMLLFTTEIPLWAAVLAGVLLLVIMVPLGFAIWFDAAEHKDDTERLLRDGRPAVAEVVGVDLVESHDGDSEVAVLRLRVSGDGVPPFEATHRGRPDPEFRPGALLYATVDPTDNLFTLERLHPS
ncbi:hypothetical protein ACRAKJ_27135 [Saccharothrix sp. DSM 118769]